jgi:hypothetical protein
MDPSEQLQRLYLAGFDLQKFDLFPNAIGVVRGDCIALFEAKPSGLQMIGAPGWKVGEFMGVLTEQRGRKVFQCKSQVIDATPERLRQVAEFRSELERELLPVV